MGHRLRRRLGFGPAIGGGLVTPSSWRWVFLVHVFAAAVTLGLLTLGVAVFGLVPFYHQGAGLGLASTAQLAMLVFSAACFVGFAVVERTSEHPMVSNYLRDRLAGRVAEPQLRTLAERIANGDEPAAAQRAIPELAALEPVEGLIGPALTHGFGMVTLYGTIAVSVIATASLVTFGRARRPSAERPEVSAPVR